MGSASISVDEFQALEQKVLQTVELIKREREAKAAAEAEVIAVKAELAARTEELATHKDELESRGQEIVALRQELVQNLQREREAVRLRVEKMLASIDEII
jgi:anti-sigma factor ChrR (cupin superfamily)